MAKYIYTPFGVKTQSARSNPDKTQVALTYDILSEGEIEGLDNGLASVFLNDVPIIDSLANEIVKVRRATVSTTASSTTITSNTFGDIRTLSHNNLSGLGLGQRTVLVEKARAKTSIASGTAGSTQVTTSSNFFNNLMISSLKNSKLRGFVRIDGAGPNGSTLVTGATFVSATEIKTEIPLATSVTNTTLHVDLVTTISGLSGNNATLSTAPGVTLSSTAVVITGANIQETRIKSLFNVDNLQFGFRAGTMTQSPLIIDSDFGQSSIIASPGIEMLQNDLRANVGTTGNLVQGYNDAELDEASQPEGTAADTLLTSAFLGVSNPSEVDEVHLTFQLPACHALKSSSGAKGASFVELQMFFEYSTDGGASYTSELAFGPSNNDIITRAAVLGTGRKVNLFTREDNHQPNNGYIKPTSPQYTAFSEEFVMNTEQFQPYDNWRIRIRRINDLNFKDSSFRHANACTLTTVESIVKDKLRYPHTSYAAVSFNAKDFNSQLPERAYTLKGLKIQVPTNYLTREETGGAAAYTRNISSGATESTYQNWDGNFRGDTATYNVNSVNHRKVFCDNPVWVFYDLLVNERYGIGQFIDKSQIDIYELFRIAKYCDEEVPDGNGGTEPRFTCNVFLSKAAEATNVLKQFASIFRGVALWNEGNLTVSVDRPKEPIYTFSKANIEGGVFTYEGTGDRVRTNQVKVTWNDPNDNFRQSTEYVEDYESIADTGRIIRAEQLAFGCTSRGQAHRLGKWKLLSEQNEKETVSFSTSLNAAGLKPGDVILVQDADKDRSSYSGRVSNYNPEAGLTLDDTKGSGGASVNIAGNDSNYTTNRFNVTVFAGEVTLPKSFTQDACMWEHGGTGVGSWLGVRDISGVDNLTLRSGEGDSAVTATSADGIVTNIPIADIPEFDGQVHTVVWELDCDNGTHRLWIDGKKYIDDATTGGGAYDGGSWSGGDAGGWLTTQSGRSGNYSANSWPVTTGSSGLRHYYNEAVSTSSDGSSTTEIELDRTISLPSYSTDYRPLLHLVYPGSGAYLAQETAIIGGTTFFEGDLLTSITSSTAAANAKDDSNNAIEVIWSENVRVEKQPVTTSAGNVSKLTVSSAFTNVPNSEVMWALKLFNTDGTEKVGTAKEFKIISVKEEDKMKFDIVAGAYFKNKFSEIDRGYVLEPRPTKIAPDPEDVIPAPNNLVINVSPEDSTEQGDTGEGNITGYKATITWDYPTNADGSKFKFCNGFEVEHNFLDEEKRILVGNTEQAITVPGIKAGGYIVRVRTRSTINTVSTYLQREVTITSRELLPPSKSRLEQVQRGGELDQSFSLNTTSGLASFGSSTYQLTSPDGTVYSNTSTNTGTHQQAFSGMGASAEAFLLFDTSIGGTGDRLKAIQVHTDTSVTPNVTYLKEVGASNNGLSSASGTATINKFSNQVDGSSTAFETDFTAGDLVKVTNGSTTTRTTAGATTSSPEVTLSSANSAIEVGMTVTGTGVGTDTVDGETASTGGIPHVVSINGVNLVLSSKQTIGSGVTLTFTPREQYVRVRHVQSDTLMFLDEIVQRPYSGTALKKQSFIPDTSSDFILAKITTDGSTTYSIAEQYVSEGGAGDPQVIKGVVYYDAWNGVPGDSSFPSSVSASSYNFDTKALVGLTSGWSEDRGTLPYAIADFKFREGDGSVTFGSIEGRGEFSRLPPGGISISVDNSARNFKFRPDSTTTTNDKTVSIPQLFNDQITTKADGTLNYDGTTAVAPTIDGIANVTDFKSRVTTALDSTGKLTSSIVSGGTSFTAAELLSLRSNFLSGDGIDFSTGTKTLKAVTPTTTDGTVLQAGGDSTSSHIPLKVLANGTGVIQGFDIFTKSGTKLFDKDTGLTSEALSSIATSTGTSVSSVTKTVSSETASDAIKITNGNSTQVVTITLTKPATSMTGFSTSSAAAAAANMPAQIVMQIKKSANADLSSSANVGTARTINKASSTTNNGGSDGANTYVITTQSENDPQFEFHDAEVLTNSNTNVLNSEGNFETSQTLSLAADEVVYIFSAISGTAGTSSLGANNVSATATRTVTVTAASGRTFNVDSSGDGSESSDADITAVSVSGTGLSGGGSTGAVTITSNATSANTASTIVARDGSGGFSSGIIEVDGLIKSSAETAFSTTANTPNASLVVGNAGSSVANGNYKGAVGFARGSNSIQIRSAIVGKQTHTSANRQGLAFLVHPGTVAGTLNEALLITHDSKVGIGTTSPATTLEVNNAAVGETVATFVGQYNSSGDVKLASFERNGGAVAAAITYADANTNMEFGTTTSHSLSLTTADTERMRIGNTGIVHIGTTSTTPAFSTGNGHAFHTGDMSHISHDDGMALSVNRGSGAGGVFGVRLAGSPIGELGTEGGDSLYIQGGAGSGSGLLFHGTGAKVLPLQNGSSVDATIDLGQSNRRYKNLYLSNAVYAADIIANGSGGLSLQTDEGTKRIEILDSGVVKFNNAYTFPTSDGSNGQALVTDGSGGLSFATISGSATGKVDIGSGFAANRVLTAANSDTADGEANLTFDGSILTVTGQIRSTGDVTAFFSSDERFKDNIKVIDNAVEKVSQIRGVEFDWNKTSEYEEFGHDIGVIAQEVEKVVPEIVIDRDDGFKAVNYQKLTALLIEAVKELKEEIKELKKDR